MEGATLCGFTAIADFLKPVLSGIENGAHGFYIHPGFSREPDYRFMGGYELWLQAIDIPLTIISLAYLILWSVSSCCTLRCGTLSEAFCASSHICTSSRLFRCPGAFGQFVLPSAFVCASAVDPSSHLLHPSHRAMTTI